ncbi:MAG: hypothetical protein GY724_08045 [Actinomycetia bacterium]|nr:hypothetical protein [Actinomycetes bacterium]MCP5030339.1 hypothetical protein [Actinomycetes bacterium]
MAELAVVLPVLLMLVFGIIELGIAFSKAQAIEAGARRGARLGSLTTSDVSDITDRVNDTLGFTADEINVTPGPCAGREGEQITVTVVHEHNIQIPFAGAWDKSLTGSAVFRCEA